MKPMQIFINILALMGGISIFVLLAVVYFQSLNHDYKRLYGSSTEEEEGKESVSIHLVKSFRLGFLRRHFISQVTKRSRMRDEWPVETYFVHPFKVRDCTKTEHLDRAKLLLVFQQNHVTASIFAIIVFISMIFLGAFREYKYLELPAASAMLLLGTMGMMVAAGSFFYAPMVDHFFPAGSFFFKFCFEA